MATKHSRRPKSFRYRLAVLAGRCLRWGMRLLGRRASQLPGELALRIEPRVLAMLPLPRHVLVVTGTNGKTSVANMVAGALRSRSNRVINNAFGSNMAAGIVSLLLAELDFHGRCKADYAVLEMDERSAHKVLPYVDPDCFMLTNLFRDSSRRNAHTDYIAAFLAAYLPPNCKVLRNHDDPIVLDFGADHPSLSFSLAPFPGEKERKSLVCDRRDCPRCGTELLYRFRRYNHIGHFVCPHCGFGAEAADVVLAPGKTARDASRLSFRGESVELPRIGTNITDLYNLLAAATLLLALGFSLQDSASMLAGATIPSSRLSERKLLGKRIVHRLAKGMNPIACSRAFDFEIQEGERVACILINSNYKTGDRELENISWLYDCDFEYLNRPEIRQIVIALPAAPDYLLRCRLAGIPPERLRCSTRELDAADLLDLEAVDTIYIFYNIYHFAARDAITERICERLRAGEAAHDSAC